jgi:hypothetical protein
VSSGTGSTGFFPDTRRNPVTLAGFFGFIYKFGPLEQDPGKNGQSPAFPVNSRKTVKNLKFWTSRDFVGDFD